MCLKIHLVHAYLNEIMPNPKGDDYDFEYIELFFENKTNVSGWCFSGIDFCFANNTILQNYTIIANTCFDEGDENDIFDRYGINTSFCFKGSLSNNGECVYLISPDMNITIETFCYNYSEEGVAYEYVDNFGFVEAYNESPGKINSWYNFSIGKYNLSNIFFDFFNYNNDVVLRHKLNRSIENLTLVANKTYNYSELTFISKAEKDLFLFVIMNKSIFDFLNNSNKSYLLNITNMTENETNENTEQENKSDETKEEHNCSVSITSFYTRTRKFEKNKIIKFYATINSECPFDRYKVIFKHNNLDKTKEFFLEKNQKAKFIFEIKLELFNRIKISVLKDQKILDEAEKEITCNNYEEKNYFIKLYNDDTSNKKTKRKASKQKKKAPLNSSFNSIKYTKKSTAKDIKHLISSPKIQYNDTFKNLSKFQNKSKIIDYVPKTNIGYILFLGLSVLMNIIFIWKR